MQDPAALRERVGRMHDRFGQPAIAEEFIEGRELYVSLIGNGDDLTVLPITEMVFDKRKSRPEERIATQSAKWDEDYRARKGIRNVFARPLSSGGAAPDRRRSAAPPSARSGSATTRGSTCGSPPTARCGFWKPTPIPSSAMDTTWPTRRRRRAWSITTSLSAWWTSGGARWPLVGVGSGLRPRSIAASAAVSSNATGRTARTAAARSSGGTPRM